MKTLTENSAALVELASLLREEGYTHTTVTPATHARVNGRPGNTFARNAADVFGWSRPFLKDSLSAELFAAMARAQVLMPSDGAWRSRLRLSCLDDLTFWHSAYPTDAANAVFFGPDTYRFARAIQDVLATRRAPVRRAIEVCCGGAPGAILVARAHAEAEVWATDINPAALALAEVNARQADVPHVHTALSNLLTDVPGEFDLIVANPPYLNDAAGRAYRHGGGALGEALSLRIVRDGMRRLAPGGQLLLYTGAAMVDGRDPLREALQPLLDSQDVAWQYAEMDPDVFGEELETAAYADVDRIAAVTLTVTAPHGH